MPPGCLAMLAHRQKAPSIALPPAIIVGRRWVGSEREHVLSAPRSTLPDCDRCGVWLACLLMHVAAAALRHGTSFAASTTCSQEQAPLVPRSLAASRPSSRKGRWPEARHASITSALEWKRSRKMGCSEGQAVRRTRTRPVHLQEQEECCGKADQRQGPANCAGVAASQTHSQSFKLGLLSVDSWLAGWRLPRASRAHHIPCVCVFRQQLIQAAPRNGAPHSQQPKEPA